MFCYLCNTIPPFFSVALSIQIHYGATVYAKCRKQSFVSLRNLVAQSYIIYIQKQNQCIHVFSLILPQEVNSCLELTHTLPTP